MKVSNCCGKHWFIEKYDGRLSGTNYYDAEEAGICPKCKEHCEYVDEKDFKPKNEIPFDKYFSHLHGSGKAIFDSFLDTDASGNCFSDADPGL